MLAEVRPAADLTGELLGRSSVSLVVIGRRVRMDRALHVARGYFFDVGRRQEKSGTNVEALSSFAVLNEIWRMGDSMYVQDVLLELVASARFSFAEELDSRAQSPLLDRSVRIDSC